MGSAILEATHPTIMVAVDDETSGINEISGSAVGSWPKTPGHRDKVVAEVQTLFRSKKPTVPAQPASGRQHQDPGFRGGLPATSTALTAQSWPAAETATRSSPGASLLEAFDVIYEKYKRRVYRQCLRMVRNPEDAEDLTQDVFLLLFRKAHTFRGEANLTTWLHRLTINTVLMRLRSRRRWHFALTSLDTTPSSEPDFGNTVALVSTLPAPPASTVEKICLDMAIARLSSGYREVFLLHDANGYRHDEIAKMLGISTGTSKSQLHKARFRLRELMGSAGSRIRDAHPDPTVRERRKSRHARDRSGNAAAERGLQLQSES